MRLLLFSDLHCQSDCAEQVVRASQRCDVLIGAGDFATVRRGIDVCISILRQIQKPTVLVPGNSETPQELTDACRGWDAATVLHGSQVVLEGVTFFGLGGAVPVTPFGDWSFDLSEDEAADLLAPCPSEAVLVSHSPPKGVVDVSSSGKSLGSRAVRDAIVSKQIRLCVCGHIHESSGLTERLGETPVVNAGPRPMMWDL